MTDLVSWLSSQLDHDEQVARAASPGPWTTGAANHSIVGPDGPLPRLAGHVVCSVGAYDRGVPSAADAEHIALHDPARVLRQVAAHRRLIELWKLLNEPALYEALEAVAGIYSDRSGFDPSWTVET